MPIEDIILKYKNKIIENMDKKKEKEMKELEDAKEKETEDEAGTYLKKYLPLGILNNKCLIFLFYLVTSNDACGSSSSSSSVTVTGTYYYYLHYLSYFYISI